MAKEYYLPNSDNDRRTWVNIFDTQLADLGPDLGVTGAEITATHNDALAVNYILDNLELFKNETKERTKYKDALFDGQIGSPLGDLPGLPTLPVAPTAVPAGVFKRIAKIVTRIKNHPNYTESLGRSLGIEGTEQTIDFDNAKVEMTLRKTDSDGIVIEFVKGKFDGVIIYESTSVPAPITDPPADPPEPPTTVWREIARVTKSPWTDTRPNQTRHPETRSFKMKYMYNDQPVGKDSDTLTVISTILPAELSGKVR